MIVIEYLSARRNVSCFVILLFLVMASPFAAHAQTDQRSWTYTKIADIDTDLPNWAPGYSKIYLEPSISDDVISFRCSFGGGGWPYFCVYTKALDGDFTAHVDNTTPMPGAEAFFWGVNGLSFSDGLMAFVGTCANPYNRGIYKKHMASNDIDIVMNAETDIPGGVGKFHTGLHEIPSINSETIVFFGAGTTEIYQEGIYAEVNGNLIAVADLNTEMPNHVGIKFDDFDIRPSSGGDYIAFFGLDTVSGARGVYRYSVENDLIEIVADELTDVPGGTDRFASFDRPVIDSENYAFWGVEQNTDKRGLFTYLDEDLGAVAMTGDSIPGAPGKYIGAFGPVSIDGRDVAFIAEEAGSSSYKSILAKKGDVLTKVIDTNEYLDGRAISAFVMTRQALCNDKVVFLVSFVDETWGIYLATLDATPAEVPSADISTVPILLRPSRPNPFDGKTTLSFALTKACQVDLSLYATDGAKVVTLIDRMMDSGRHRMEWDGLDRNGKLVPAGVYFIKLRQDKYVAVDRLVLLK
ncbi:MAG: hypothetical protein KJ970_09295 [Candidatus Eisenbacteria bacterium]|uniref:T9SS type A sorting domain-containing protein n=1 Tax=Eiseniibacteriota bacterium TaxID=2212470 RepID=A0A948RU86_UNCEI|nr:hypothetical protein [Candidatus Eisenbacteria bacterium]